MACRPLNSAWKLFVPILEDNWSSGAHEGTFVQRMQVLTDHWALSNLGANALPSRHLVQGMQLVDTEWLFQSNDVLAVYEFVVITLNPSFRGI